MIFKEKLLIIVFCVLIAGCAADANFTRTALIGDQSQSWQDKMIQMRRKYEVFVGKNTKYLVNEMGKPSAIKYDILRSGHRYDEEWNYTFSNGIPLLTESQSAVWFYIENGGIVAIDVWQ